MSKEMPEFKPISKEERDKMEGNLEKRDWKTTMEELESKARGILPEELKKLETEKRHQVEKLSEKDGEETKTLEELKEEAGIYIETFEELMSQSRELREKYDKRFFSPELLESVANLTSAKEALLDLYDSSKNPEAQKQTLKMLSETLKIRNYLLVEFMRRAKSKKDSEEQKGK